MAVVITSEESDYFSSSSLRRSHSQPQFLGKETGFHSSASASRIDDLYKQPVKVFADAELSSAPPSPETIHAETSDLSFSSTPASNLSLDSECEGRVRIGSVPRNEEIILPQYDESGFYSPGEELEPPPSPRTGDSYTVSPNDAETSTNTSRPESPDAIEHAEDDTAVRVQPSRHVDYLSHNWREEDIWESWKYIVSKRGEYSNGSRLENASWRTWMKAKNNLKTVSPETLNWLKDCDVTWLYGPLQTGHGSLMHSEPERKSGRMSKSGSFVDKKPILKKRSMSEIMLQRSLSASSLVKQAAAAVQAQQKEGNGRTSRPILSRATTDYVTFPFSSRRVSPKATSGFASSTTSGLESPSSERKHIHFNEQVEQCIAVEIKGEDDDEFDPGRYGYGSDSDDGAIMMKKTVQKKRRPILKRTRSNAGAADSKTIAMLPSTTLKYREDTPEPPETAMKHSTGGVYRSPVLLSPSSSQETLRPSKPSGKMFFAAADDDDDDDDDDADEEGEDRDSLLGWRPSKATSMIGIGDAIPDRPTTSGLRRSTSSNSLSAEPAGMRRTESGMFMPYEEGDESGRPNEGIFGRVIDTVNTARDIAHVIWNVGWRK